MKKSLRTLCSLVVCLTLTTSSLVFAAPHTQIAYKVYQGNTLLKDTSKLPKVKLADQYGQIPGVFTFRGGPHRDGGSYGTVTPTLKQLEKKWSFTTHSSSWGGGAGWTGQPALIKWPSETKAHMNLYPAFQSDPNFVEVIYASLSGYVYFLDLATGKPSRPSIKIGNPIKGSVSIDPRGYPLLYVGEGIPEKGSIGYNIYSLIDGKRLYHLNGIDSVAGRGWGAFDSSALVDGANDTLIVGGENGLLYVIKLMTNYNQAKGTLSINPTVYKLKYGINGAPQKGIESSVAIHDNLVYFADNSGHITCVNLHTLQPLWTFNSGDDTDASVVVEVENGTPYVYTGNEVDFQGTSGTCTIRKLNGLTGAEVWQQTFPCKSIIGSKAVNGGLLASPALGKNNLSDLVFFSIARYKAMQPGLIIAVDKRTGKTRWTKEMTHYMWSSPVTVYDRSGTGYLIQCDSAGNMFLLDGLTGKELHRINLGSNIEATPAIFNNTIVVAPRGNKIIGVTLK